MANFGLFNGLLGGAFGSGNMIPSSCNQQIAQQVYIPYTSRDYETSYKRYEGMLISELPKEIQKGIKNKMEEKLCLCSRHLW